MNHRTPVIHSILSKALNFIHQFYINARACQKIYDYVFQTSLMSSQTYTVFQSIFILSFEGEPFIQSRTMTSIEKKGRNYSDKFHRDADH